MIQESYVSFETAKLLKEKGFNEPCIATYNLVTKKFEVEEVYQDWTTRWVEYVSAPTLQMAMKWLRKVHNIFISILQIENTTVTMEQEYFFYRIQKNRRTINIIPDTFKEPEQAAEAAIKYCLENLI